MNLARITQAGLLWLSLLGLAGCFSPPPKQQALMTRFHAERPDYEALRKMMREDGITDILHYGDEFEKGERRNFKSAEKIGLSPIRAGAYRSLMKKIDVPRAFSSEHDEAALLLDSWGMANRGWRAWSYGGRPRRDRCWTSSTISSVRRSRTIRRKATPAPRATGTSRSSGKPADPGMRPAPRTRSAAASP